MRIMNLLDKNAILLNADISDKNTAINTPVSYTHLTLPTICSV